MDRKKRRRLQAGGWTVGSVADFLDLSPTEITLIEIRVALHTALRRRRLAEGLTQTAFAKRLGSSQSRVAKLEAGDPSVSLDLLIRALVALGADRREVAAALTVSPRKVSRPRRTTRAAAGSRR